MTQLENDWQFVTNFKNESELAAAEATKERVLCVDNTNTSTSTSTNNNNVVVATAVSAGKADVKFRYVAYFSAPIEVAAIVIFTIRT